MFFSLELLEKFKGQAKMFEMTGVRDNERRLYLQSSIAPSNRTTWIDTNFKYFRLLTIAKSCFGVFFVDNAMTIDNNVYKIKTYFWFIVPVSNAYTNPYLIRVIFLYFHFKCLLIAGMRFSVIIMHDFVPRLYFRIWFTMK